MKKKSIIYIILMVTLFMFTYLFIYSGVNTKVKTFVNYQEDSNVNYQVSLKENDIYDSKILGSNKNYIASLVDSILIDFDYKAKYSEYMSGFYSYSVESTVVAYEDDINDSLWNKNFKEMDDKVSVLNQNKIDMIKINDKVQIDYGKYKKMIDDFKEDYQIDISGYLMVKIKIKMMVDFSKFNNQVEDESVIKVIIPLSYDTFKIKVINDNNKIDNYEEFTKKSSVNYLLLIMGALCGSIGLAILVTIIKEMKFITESDSKYRGELKEILDKYKDEIVVVDKLYNKKKYNLIYVDSFLELLDVYKKVDSPISFKEMGKNSEAIFLIIEEDNAWIYRLVADKKKGK